MSEFKTSQFQILSLVLLFSNVYIFKTLILFNNFLSQPLIIGSSNGTGQLGSNVSVKFSDWFHPLVMNFCLLELFYIQHSVVKNPIAKVLQHWGIEYLERSVFNLLSATVLQILMYFWHPVTFWALWNLNIEPYSLSDWALYFLRSLTWLALLSECVVLDISDLLGWKQVVYHFHNLPPPSTYRSRDLNQMFANMRHPGLLELWLLLWATPTLSLDRLVCSVSLSVYVLLGFSGQCAAYVRRERTRKLNEVRDKVNLYGHCSAQALPKQKLVHSGDHCLAQALPKKELANSCDHCSGCESYTKKYKHVDPWPYDSTMPYNKSGKFDYSDHLSDSLYPYNSKKVRFSPLVDICGE
uniref:Nuclear envelope membrane protein n=1 Tax=Cacopsylla melanoneura TaxID=428564 RepID=A0A8D8V4T4_9HEMI